MTLYTNKDKDSNVPEARALVGGLGRRGPWPQLTLMDLTMGEEPTGRWAHVTVSG